MTTLVEEPPVVRGPEGPEGPPPQGPELELTPSPAPETAETEEAARAGAPILFVGASAALSSASAAWLVGGLLDGPIVARIIAFLGVAIGVGMMAFSFTLRRATLLQYAVVPVAALVGAALVAPSANGGTANLIGLIVESVRGGGLQQPPIPFDPGWRFILVGFFGVMGAAAVALPVGLNRPRLAVVVPLPIVFGAALLQPKGQQLVSSVIAMLLLVAAVAVSYGADIAERTGGAGAGFEGRRLMRAGGMLGIIAVLMVVLSQTSFLFPDSNKTQILQPQKPSTQPMISDRVLMNVHGSSPGPWRLGVLDVYDGADWLLPPFDPSQVVPISGNGHVPDAPHQAAGGHATFDIVDMPGRTMPVPGGLEAVTSTASTGIEFEPNSDVPMVADRLPQGFEYYVTTSAIPTGKQLDAAGAGVPPDCPASCLYVPAPPSSVRTLLSQAPPALFDRLQFLRNRLYQNVIASGAGNPLPVTPARINQLLKPNAEATPYEITAAEALLARWAGLPSRIAFGYYSGNQIRGGYEVHPRNGAAWLEVYFKGDGWVPLVGVPPRAKTSLDNQQKQTNPAVQASPELALTVFVPVRQITLLALWELLQWWIGFLSPFAAGVAAILVGYPIALKLLRRRRRRKWAEVRGPIGRALVTYAELRDRCYDLNLGDVRMTPLEFAGSFLPDAEHDELAWLITRVLWGDLRRDPHPDDAAAAEEMAHSVMKRIHHQQQALNQGVAWISRASLRDPYTSQIPNLWWSPRLSHAAGAAIRSPLWLLRHRPRPFRRVAALPATTLIVLLLSGCGLDVSAQIAHVPSLLPSRIVPAPPQTVLGYEFVREPAAEQQYAKAGPDSLVKAGRVYAVEKDGFIEGSIQVTVYPQTVDLTDDTTRDTVTSSIGGGAFSYRVGPVKLQYIIRPDQRVWLWFVPDQNATVIFVFRQQFALADALVRAILLYHHGLAPDAAGTAGAAAAPCPSAATLTAGSGGPIPQAPVGAGGPAGGASPSPSASPSASSNPGYGDVSLLPCPKLQAALSSGGGNQ